MIEFIKLTLTTSFVLYDEADADISPNADEKTALLRSKERYAEVMSGVEKLINVRHTPLFQIFFILIFLIACYCC